MSDAQEMLKKAFAAEVKSPRGQLEPYIESIAVLLDKKWTHQQIASWLKEQGVCVKFGTLSNFCSQRKNDLKFLAKKLGNPRVVTHQMSSASLD